MSDWIEFVAEHEPPKPPEQSPVAETPACPATPLFKRYGNVQYTDVRVAREANGREVWNTLNYNEEFNFSI